jgi:hypothetical protein
MSTESTEQGNSGKRGAEASRQAGSGDQPRQGDQRTEFYGTGDREEKHHFAPGHAPSEQGDNNTPGPEKIKEHQQGFGGAGGGHHGARGANTERSEEIASAGEPRGEHARHGRQHLDGDRPRE